MKRVIPAVLLSALVLTGCVPDAPSQSGESNTLFVQDFWIIDSGTALNSEYEWVELMPALIEQLPLHTADESLELRDGLLFHRFDSLKPKMTDTAGNTRTDVGMIAGLIQNDHSISLAVLGSPERNTPDPIGIDDYVLVDLTLIDHLITPGDPVLIDYALLQAVPTAHTEETALDGIELLKYRFEQDFVLISGAEVDGKPQALNYVGQLGMILQGSTVLGIPAKAEAMAGGLGEGVTGCLEEMHTLIFGLKCTQSIMEDFGLGVIDSWKQLEENFEPFDEVDVVAERNKYFERTINNAEIPCPQGEVRLGGGGCVPTCASGNCDGGGATGDPHILTFDGQVYSMHGLGEFLLMQSDSMTLQMRTQQTSPGRNVASVSAVAMRANNTEFFVDSEGIWVNGSQIQEPQVTIDDHIITQTRHRMSITNGADYFVTITHAGWPINVHIDIDRSVHREVIGMLGNNNGVQDDFITRDGLNLGSQPRFRDFYQSFVNSWRITEAESLFRYEAGQNTGSFTHPNFPAEDITSASFPDQEREIAERLCLATGLKYSEFVEACMVDILVLAELEDLSFIGQLRATQPHYVSEVRAMRVHDYPTTSLWGGKKLAPKPWEVTAPEDRPPGSDENPFYTVTWEESAARYLNFSGEAEYSCPGNGVVSPVWGGQNRIYDTKSSLCTAAVHAGLIDPMRGGTVTMMLLEGRFNQDIDFVQNGITGQAETNFEGFQFIQY